MKLNDDVIWRLEEKGDPERQEESVKLEEYSLSPGKRRKKKKTLLEDSELYDVYPCTVIFKSIPRAPSERTSSFHPLCFISQLHVNYHQYNLATYSTENFLLWIFSIMGYLLRVLILQELALRGRCRLHVLHVPLARFVVPVTGDL